MPLPKSKVLNYFDKLIVGAEKSCLGDNSLDAMIRLKKNVHIHQKLCRKSVICVACDIVSVSFKDKYSQISFICSVLFYQ